MNALRRKLLRDLWHLRSQSFAIAVVVAAGVAIFVAMNSLIVWSGFLMKPCSIRQTVL